MENYEKFLEIKAEIDKFQSQLPGMKNDLLLKERAQSNLDEEAGTAGILKEKGWQKKEEAARENEAAVVALHKEISRIERWTNAVEKKSEPAQELALKDLREHYRRIAEPLVKEWVKRLRAACEIENQLVVLQDEADGKRLRVTPYTRIVWPTYPHFLTNREGRFEDGPLGWFIVGLKRDGFDVDGDLK